jgi:LAGLIDADG endonuclease
MQEVAGSIPVASTLGFQLAGVVAGEGSFSSHDRGVAFVRDGSPRRRFVFAVSMAARDRPLLEQLQRTLGCGLLGDRPARKPGWLPTTEFTVSVERDLVKRVIPFMERFLFPCAKRVQFERWRDDLIAYRRDRPSQYGRGPSMCSVPGCGRTVRGRGVCRVHYYRLTGY